MQRPVIIAALIAVVLLSAKPSSAMDSSTTIVPTVHYCAPQQKPAFSPAFEKMKGRRRADEVHSLLL